MAHFRGTVQGGRGSTSRLGHKTSGLRVNADGWDIGGSVQIRYDSESDCDIVRFYVSGGSGPRGGLFVGEFKRDRETGQIVEVKP